MLLFSLSEDKDQLMLRPIEGAHSAIVFRPYTKVEERIVRLLASQQDLCRVAPIHAYEVNGAVPAVAFQKRKCTTQEIEKL